MNTRTPFDADIVAWSQEQAELLRARRFEALDIENLAEAIEDVGKSEQRALERRMTVLLAHLLIARHQPEFCENSWLRTIQEQRRAIRKRLEKTPSLARALNDPEWLDLIWPDVVSAVLAEADLDNLPESCPWTVAEILDLES
jgi:hypothetical protein